MVTMKVAALSLAVAALSVGLTGCACHEGSATAQVKSAPATGTSEDATASNEGPQVAEGTQFRVRLNQGLSSQHSYAGQPFTAIVETPLRATNGDVLVPKGALLHGEVVDANISPADLTLRFSTVETDEGRTRVEASIRASEQKLYRVRTTAFKPSTSEAYSVLLPPSREGVSPSLAQPANAYLGPTTLTELDLPRGSSMQLVLTQPLLAPGMRLAPLR